MFAVAASIVISVVGFSEWSWYRSAGAWTSSSKAVLLVIGWLLIFLAYRFRKLTKEQSDGTFSEERYAADPSGYIVGSPREKMVAVVVGVVIVLVYTALSLDW